MKKLLLTLVLLCCVSTAFAGTFTFTTSCGDTYTIEYPDDMDTKDLMNRLLLLDTALCGEGNPR